MVMSASETVGILLRQLVQGVAHNESCLTSRKIAIDGIGHPIFVKTFAEKRLQRGRLSSENLKRSGACSNKMLGFWTAVVEVGLESRSCAVGWKGAQ
jgi:hypothetical protein